MKLASSGRSEKDLEAWLKLDPKSTAALQRLAVCLFREKDPDGALEKLKAAAKIDPEVLTPKAILAQYYSQTGDQNKARKWMIEALTDAPRDLKTRLVAAQWAWEQGQLDEAKKQAAAALSIEPNSIEAKLMFGVIALFQKDYRTAETYFENAYLQKPSNFPASNNLALALVEQKDDTKKQRAWSMPKRTCGSIRNRARPPRRTVGCFTNWASLTMPRRCCGAAVSGGSFTADTAYYLARVLADRGRDADAKPLLESALKSSGPFMNRDEATDLLKKLKK